MSALSGTRRDSLPALHRRPRQVAVIRGLLALAWAAALVLAVGDRVPTTGSDLPFAVAALVAAYPAIDVIASLAGAAADRVLAVNAAISAVAVAAIAASAFGPTPPPRWWRSARGRRCRVPFRWASRLGAA